MQRNLVLIGFMGTGKSTVGRLCAPKLGCHFADSDAVAETQAGKKVAEIFAEQGEPAFRALEREVITKLATTPKLVLATGGGAVLDAENVLLLRAKGFVVWLTASPEQILARIGDAKSRPLLADASDPKARIAQLLQERHQYYATAAHWCVDTTGRTPQEVAQDVAVLYESASHYEESTALAPRRRGRG